MPFAFSVLAKTFGNAAINNIVAPTFAGITSVVANLDSTFSVSWSPATGGAATPINYEVYIALGNVSAGTLFQASNMAKVVQNNTTKIFMLADGVTYFVRGQVYTLGVRARSASGIQDSNTAILTAAAVAPGNLPVVYTNIANQLADIEANLAQDHLDLAQDHADFVAALAILDGYLTDFNAKLTVLQGYLATMSANNDSLEASALSIAASATAINNATADVVAAAASIDASADSLETSATAILAATSALDAAIDTLEADLATLTGQLSDLGDDITELEAVIAGLQGITAQLVSAAVGSDMDLELESAPTIDIEVQSEDETV